LSKEREIREKVLKMSKSKILKGFYATAIQKQMNADLELVQKVLIDMVEEGILLKEFELICSNEHCLRSIDSKDALDKFKTSYDCEFCGEVMEELEPSHIKLRFLINKNHN